MTDTTKEYISDPALRKLCVPCGYCPRCKAHEKLLAAAHNIEAALAELQEDWDRPDGTLAFPTEIFDGVASRREELREAIREAEA